MRHCITQIYLGSVSIFLLKFIHCYCLVDGFNVYHFLKKNFPKRKSHYFNLSGYLKSQIPKEAKVSIFFFTAYPSWNEEKKRRHKKYVQYLNSTKIQVVLGRFKKVQEKFLKNNMKIIFPEGFSPSVDFPEKIIFQNHEEKETDVNIAVKVLELSYVFNAENILLLTADSDIIPAVKNVRRFRPQINIQNIPLIKKGQKARLPLECSSFSIPNREEMKKFFIKIQ